MTRKRELTLDASVEAALCAIQKFNYTSDRIVRRWTVRQIDEMCFELGLPIQEGEKEVSKALRLRQAVLGNS